MRKFVVMALFAAAVLGAFVLWRIMATPDIPTPPHVAAQATERIIAQGRLIGFADESNTYAWLGIPYAQPPVGELRWRAPRPPRPWQGTREALQFGAACPQLGSVSNGAPREAHGTVIGAEDCLTLNVWAPRVALLPPFKQRLPVMVWVHGGGNVNGSSAMYPFVRNLADPYRLIVVSVNYRLGLLGWFHHPSLYDADTGAEDRSGNYGLLDIIQALHWVQENIAAFGGDPDRVTVVGESGGGFDVYSLLAAPAARGLFHGAIAQSGGLGRSTLEYAENYRDDPVPGHERSAREVVNQLLMLDGRAGDRQQAKTIQNGMDTAALRAYLRDKTPAQLLAAITEDGDKTIMVPDLFGDGEVLPKEDLLTLFREGRYTPVPFIAGSNHDETKPFNLFNPEFSGLRFGVLPYVRDQAQFDRISAYGAKQWKLFAVDQPLAAMSAHGPVFGYRFDWDDLLNLLVLDMGKLIGAGHAQEINFVFNAMQPPQMIGTFYGNASLPARTALARAMSSYWAEFAYSGRPGRGRDGYLPEWGAWQSGAGSFIVFDSLADGGIRMSDEVLTEQALRRQLQDDRASGLIDSDRQLCRWFAELFINTTIPGVRASESDYADFAGGVCKAYPAAEFPGMRTL